MKRSDRVLVIAEAGVNHNGSLEIAKRLVDAAADGGADYVKFQTFKAENLVTLGAPKAEYQIKNTGSAQSQFEMLKSLELKQEDHFALAGHCAEREIGFLSTPFDLDSLAFLVDAMKLDLIKISSGDMTNAPLLLELARRQCKVILSTGMATLDEVEAALAVLAFGYAGQGEPCGAAFSAAYESTQGKLALAQKVTLLHCTTEYPTPVDNVNLRAMDTLNEHFSLNTGYSDHTVGSIAAIAAVARGACIIEKHITLDRRMEGPDHLVSLEPDGLAQLVRDIRDVERCLGHGEKAPTQTESKNKLAARKCVVASCRVSKGDPFTVDNITVKRAGEGASALGYFDWLGRTADRDYAADDVIL